ncbi:MAG: hypothetical protein Q4A34_00545 [Candidatus Saccharibacteria bacterium]|nr:hypothetical protein [Candidatus Saccharibacteria bacterium]
MRLAIQIAMLFLRALALWLVWGWFVAAHIIPLPFVVALGLVLLGQILTAHTEILSLVDSGGIKQLSAGDRAAMIIAEAGFYVFIIGVSFLLKLVLIPA